MSDGPRIVGAVLCGGASRRMGTDKALLLVEGVAMARRVADALRAGGCEQVVAIGGDTERLAALGLDVVPDETPGEGPLGGILTALHALVGTGVTAPQGAIVVVAACDLPHLTGATIAELVSVVDVPSGAEPWVAAVAQPVGSHRPSLCAAWRTDAEPHLARRFASGERRVRVAIEDLPHVVVHIAGDELANVNTTDDLRQ